MNTPNPIKKLKKMIHEVEDMKNQYLDQKDEIHYLRILLEEKEVLIEKQKKQIKALENQKNFENIAQSHQWSDEQISTINELLTDIDECINLLDSQ